MKQTLQLITKVQSQGENKITLHELREMLDKEFPLDDTMAEFTERDTTKFLAHDIRKIGM